MNLSYFAPPVGWQEWVDEAPTRNVLVHGGRQIGKSRSLIRIQLQAVFAGLTSYYSCPNVEIAENNWLDLCNSVTDLGSDRTRVNKVDRGVIEVQTSDGRRGVFRRLSSGAKGNMRGARAHTLFHDELQLTPDSREYFANTSALTLTTGGRTLVAVTSPDTPARYYASQWMVDEMMAREPQEGLTEKWTNPRLPDWTFMRIPTTPETLWPILRARDLIEGEEERSQADYERQATDVLDATRTLIGERAFRREYLCAWEVDAGGGVLDMFSPALHVSESAEFDPDRPFYLGIDEGRGVAKTAVLFIQRHERPSSDPTKGPDYDYVVFDELTATRRIVAEALVGEIIGFCTDTGTTSMVRSQKWGRAPSYGLPDFAAPDPRAPYVVDALRDAGMDVRVGTVPVEQAISRINRHFERGRLRIHPRCHTLIREMTQWTRAANGEPKESNCDCSQALGYALTRLDKHFGMDEELAQARKLIRAKRAARPSYLYAPV